MNDRGVTFRLTHRYPARCHGSSLLPTARTAGRIGGKAPVKPDIAELYRPSSNQKPVCLLPAMEPLSASCRKMDAKRGGSFSSALRVFAAVVSALCSRWFAVTAAVLLW